MCHEHFDHTFHKVGAEGVEALHLVEKWFAGGDDAVAGRVGHDDFVLAHKLWPVDVAGHAHHAPESKFGDDIGFGIMRILGREINI